MSLTRSRLFTGTTLSGVLITQIALLAASPAVADTANATIMTNPISLGTTANPMLLSTLPSQQPISISMLSPGTAGAPGPTTAHHGINTACTKKNFFSTAPAIGEMDCVTITARQDGIGTTSGSDAGGVGAIVADVQSTLRAQNFSGYMEAHSTVVDTTTNTLPYYMDLQEGIINTTGHPDDDGTTAGKSYMNAYYAALIDGHGSGFSIVEQTDTTGHGGKLGHGIIDTIIQAARYTGQQTYRVDGNGATSATMWQIGTDPTNTNLELGMPTNPSGSFAKSTPYIDFNGLGTVSNVRLISDAAGQLTIVNQGTPSYSFSKKQAYFIPPAYFVSTVTAGNLVLNGGIIFPLAKGNQTILTTDANGALHVGGTGANSTLSIDEPVQSAAVVSTGDVLGSTLSSGSSVTYGKSAGSGAHQITEMALSGSVTTGTVVLTPQGGTESGTNTLGSIVSGGANVVARVVCQNGVDIASWSVEGNYLVTGGALKLMAATAMKDMTATAGAITWQATPAVNAVLASPDISVSISGSSAAKVSCTAKAELIVVK